MRPGREGSGAGGSAARGVPARVAEIEAELLAPGGPFELEVADVLGSPVRQLRRRAPSLGALLDHSRGFGETPYLCFTDGVDTSVLTYAEHARRAAALAAHLRDRFGLRPGDRVAILGANSPEWVIACFAIVSAGAVAVGLNAWWTAAELRFALSDAEPRLLLCDRRRLERLGEPGVPTLVLDEDTAALPDAELPGVDLAEDDPALMLYTSGTTGRPKAAVHSHRNVSALLGLQGFMAHRAARLAPAAAGAPPPCPLVTSPLFHVSGLHTAAIALLGAGVRSVWWRGRFDPGRVLATIERERVTGWGYTQALLHRLVHHPGVAGHDLSSVRTLGGGGSPIPPALQARARELFPNARPTLAVGYGSTECTALATLAFGEELLTHPTSVGRPLPGIELEIRDDDGHAVAEGAEGTVWVRGPTVMLGYFRRPRENAETIGPGRWLCTGDVGRLEAGRLFLHARRRDLILRGGENVYPAEIEARLEEHPDVAEAAVLGVSHPELGQAVKAIVVPRSGAHPDPVTLSTFCAEALAYFKVPAQWEIRTDALPRNAMGKVLKEVLRGADSAFVED